VESSGADTAVLKSIGATFDHVAHAVPSIRLALPLYRDVLGGRVAGGGFNEWGGHLAVHFVYPGGGRVELLEQIHPESTSMANFLRRSPRGGLHHLTFKVQDLREAIQVVESAGFLTFGTVLDGSAWQETYLHPRTTGGVLIQLAQSPPGVPPPFDRPIEAILDEADSRRRRFSPPQT